jgi:hypothetical protein
MLGVPATPFLSLGYISVVSVWSRTNSSIAIPPPQQRRFSIHCYIHGINQLNAIAAARINTPPHQLTTKQTRRWNLQATQNRLLKIIRAVIQRKTEFTKTQHRL